MRATVMFGAGDVRIENIPDAGLIESTDAIVVVSRACICDSDLWPYRGLEEFPKTGRGMGHEAKIRSLRSPRFCGAFASNLRAPRKFLHMAAQKEKRR